MTATIQYMTAASPDGYGPTNLADLITGWIDISSDRAWNSGGTDVVTMADILTALNNQNSGQTHLSEVLPGFTYICRTWILVRENVTLDMRNTNVDFLSGGTGAASGAGFQLRAFSGTTGDRNQTVTAANRATLLTGNTLIIIRNRDAARQAYGPFQRNSRWRNEGGNTIVMCDGGPRYDWASNWDSRISVGNITDFNKLAIYDFQSGFVVNIVGLATSGQAHTYLHPDSVVNGYQILDAIVGGTVTAGSTTPFAVVFGGGVFFEAILGNEMLGAGGSKLAGAAEETAAVTAFFERLRLSSPNISVTRRKVFLDVLGVVGSQLTRTVSDANKLGTVTLLGQAGSGSNSGMFRVAHRWQPTFRTPSAERVANHLNGCRLAVLMGTVARSLSSAAPNYYDTGADMGVTLHATDGGILWTDPWTRARPEPGRTDLVRRHVRLPAYWTREQNHADGAQSFRATQITWQMFMAGYLPPSSPTAVAYPVVGREFGDWEGELSVGFDEAFIDAALTVANVATARSAASGIFTNAPAESAEALNVYRALMWMLEADKTTYPTVASAWAAHAALDPSYRDGVFRLEAANTVIRFNGNTTNSRSVSRHGSELRVRTSPIAGQGYGTEGSIILATWTDGLILDTPIVSVALLQPTAIQGVTLRRNTRIDLDRDSDFTLPVNGVTGAVLTVNNTGSGTIKVLTDSPDNVAAGNNAEILTRVSVQGLPVQTTSDPALASLYLVPGGGAAPTLVASRTNEASPTWDGLTPGADYRLVWSLAGYEPIIHDIPDITAGNTVIHAAPEHTANADPTNLIPQGAGESVSWDAANERLIITCDVRYNMGRNYRLDGAQTNALFEEAKGSADFNQALATLNVLNLIRHPSEQETSLLQNRWLIRGINNGLARHQIQAVAVHGADSLVIGGEEPTVQFQSWTATVDGSSVTSSLPEVVILPSVVALTLADGSILLEALEAGLSSRVHEAADAVRLDSVTPDGEAELLQTIWKSGAV